MRYTFLALLLAMSCRLGAQTDSIAKPPLPEPIRSISILTGYDGWQHHYAELGIARRKERMIIPASFTSVYYASAEVRPARRTIVGMKTGAWVSGGCGAMCMGISGIWYTDGKENSARLRPEIGFGVGPIKVTYGYSIPLFNRDFEGVNTHTVSAAFLIDVKQLRGTHRSD